MIERLILFGATGDLAGRYLFPAIAALLAGGHLPDGFAVTAAARQDLDEDAFRRHVDERLAEHAGGVPKAACRTLLRSLRYRSVDVTDPGSVASTLVGPALPVAVYLALPPNRFPAAVEGVGQAGPCGGGRIVLEKPFGEDLDSAVELNRLLAEVVGDAGEQAVFRVDHVLGMATAQNLVRAPPQPRTRLDLERNTRRAGRDPLGGDAGPRRPRRLLRHCRGAQGRSPEPHAPTAVPRRDGAVR